MIVTFWLASAWASSVYPSELTTVAGMPCQPTCTVCHETNSGGTGSVTRDFGIAMMDRGLLGGGQTDLLGAAFDTLVADEVDSDGDGTPDADELAAGADPNPDGAPFCNLVTPEYGCFNSSATPASLVAALGGLVAVALGRRRSVP